MTAAPSNSSTRGGLGFVGALTIAFVVLRLTGVIAWSWWWVLSPVWIATGLVVLVVLGGVAYALATVPKKPGS